MKLELITFFNHGWWFYYFIWILLLLQCIDICLTDRSKMLYFGALRITIVAELSRVSLVMNLATYFEPGDLIVR